MRQEKEAKVTDESERERTERNKEVNTRAGEGTFPLGLVTMLFLVLFVWGCAGKHNIRSQLRKGQVKKGMRERSACTCTQITLTQTQEVGHGHYLFSKATD